MTSVFGANAVAGAVPMVDVLSSLVQGANASAVHDPAGLLHDMRRGGGGGGDPIAKPIGVMMMMLAVLSAGAHMSHQSQISAALLTGLIFGGLQLDMKSHGKWESLFSSELNITLIELGNVLVLFFAGLSVDVSKVTLYWWPIVVVGSGYGLFATALFAWLGWQSGLCFEPGSVVFFGICCSLSSKQLMVDHLTRVNQYKTLHSSILQGVALFQDGIAIVAMAILDAFQRVKMEIDPIPTRRAEAAVSK
jgi:Kef-type K+ transport system membrane component KefB